MKVKDHMLSQEVFELKYLPDLDVYQTHPIPQDLSKYYESEQYLSHSEVQNTLFEKAYQWVKSYMLSKKRHILAQQLSHKGVLLDYGAGSGAFAAHMQQNGWQVTALEPNAKAQKLINAKSVNAVSSLSQLPNTTYDVITLWHVLEHIPNYEQVLEQLKSKLSKNGKLIIAVPNFKSFDAKHYKEHWAAWDVPRHLWHFSPSSIAQMATDLNMELTKQYPMWFDAFYVSILSEKYQKHKMPFLKGVLLGAFSNFKALINGQFSSKIYVLALKNE